MATIKVKFRQSTVKGKPGTVYYQICHAGSNKQITTRIHVYPEEWDEENGQILAGFENEHSLQMYRLKIENDLRLLHRIIRGMDGQKYTPDDVVKMYHSKSSQVTVLAYMDSQIEQMKTRKKFGTARNYRSAFNSLSAFLNGEDISFSLMNEGFILKYNDWLSERGMIVQEEKFDGFYAVCTDLEDEAPAILKANAGGNRFTPNEITSTLADMNFLSIQGEGYIPANTSNSRSSKTKEKLKRNEKNM